MKIDFRITTEIGDYSDALDLPDDHQFTAEEIEAMKQERAQQWVALVHEMSSVAEPQVQE